MTTHRRIFLARESLAVCSILAFGCLAAPSTAIAQTTLTWTGATNQFWGNSANWDTGNAPTATDDALFDGSASLFTPNLGAGNRTVASLTIDSATAYTISNPQGVWLAPGDVTVSSGTGHTFATTINLADGSNPTYTIASGSDLTISGVIDEYDGGTAALTKAGAGTLIFTADNLYDGTTTLTAGTLQLGDGGTTGSLTGDVATSSGATLAFGRSDPSLTFAGAISGTGGVTQNGTGVLSLTGANSFSGDVTINSGQILLGSATEFSTNTVVNNTTDGLALNGFDATLGGLAGSGNLTLGTHTLAVGGNNADTTYAGVLSGTGGLTKEGTGTLTLTGNHTYTGGTTIGAGTLQLGDGSATGIVAGDIVNDGALIFNHSNSFIFNNVISGTGSLTKEGAGSVKLKADNTYTGGTTINAGTLQIGKGGTTGSVVGDIVDNAALVFSRSNDFAYSGIISGTGKVTKSGGEGTLILSGDSTFTGSTLVLTGTLQLGDGGTTGSIVGDVLVNGTLAFNRSDASLVFAGAISSEGGVTQNGSGVLSLTGANTFTGDVTINRGQILLGSATEFAANTVVNNTTDGLDLNGFDPTLGGLAGNGDLALGTHTLTVGGNNADTAYSGALSGTGGLTKEGTGTLTLSGGSSYLGATSVEAGTLQLEDSGTELSVTNNIVVGNSGAGDFNLLNGATASGGSIAIASATTGIGHVLVSGSGSELTSADRLFIGSNGTGTLDIAAGGVVNGVFGYIGSGSVSGDGTVTVTGAGTQLNLADYDSGGTITRGNLTIGKAGTGRLSITDGGVVNSLNGYLADTYTTGTATVEISGSGSQWNMSNDFIVGSFGTGSLLIEDGGYVKNSMASVGNNEGAVGYATVTGTDTEWSDVLLYVGRGGTGTFTVADGALVDVGTNAYIARWETGYGTATVTGAGSEWRLAGKLNVGYEATGILHVENGGLVSSAHGYLGYYSGSSGTVDVSGTGSQWTLSGDLYVGVSGSGSLSISADGSVTASGLFDQSVDGATIVDGGTLSFSHFQSATASLGTISLSDPAGGSALTVGADDGVTSTFAGVIQDYSSGPGSIVKTGSNTVILSGNNTYTGGTTIEAGTLSVAGGDNLGTGTITFDGGTLALTSASSFDQPVSVGAGGGTLASGGVVTLSGDVTVDGPFAAANGLSLSGTVNGSGAFTGAVTVDGTLSPGHSPGTMSFENLTLGDGSTLQIELGGTGQGVGYDFVNVSGTAMLGGTLDVVWYDGFTASVGDTFNFLTGGSGVTGSFGVTTFPDLDAGLEWQFTQGTNTLSLTAVSAVPEPATWSALAGLGMLGVALWRRRADRGRACS